MTSLSPALDAERQTLQTDAGGLVSYYADRASESVRDGGHGEPPLLLLHSINAAPSAMEVKPLFEHYRGERPVFALELPGFGFSERAERDYSPELYAATIAEFLAAVCRAPADVIALSTSAEFVARAALAAPSSVRSLALISPTGMGSREPPGDAARERLGRFFKLPVLSSGLFRLIASRPSIRFFMNQSFVDEAPEEVVDYACATVRQPGAAHAPFAFLSMRLFTQRAVETLYQPLAVPVLVLFDEDPNIDFERLPELRAANPGIGAMRISPTRGLPHWEEPERTFAAIDAFWAAAA